MTAPRLSLGAADQSQQQRPTSSCPSGVRSERGSIVGPQSFLRFGGVEAKPWSGLGQLRWPPSRLTKARSMSNQAAEESRLSHQLSVLKHGAWIILLTTAVVAAAAVGLSLRQGALYQASADVFLGSETSTDLTVGTSAGDPKRELSTQARLARLPAVAAKALEDASVREPAGNLLGSSSVTTSGDADILTFSVVYATPELTSRLATAYAKAYTEYRRRVDTSALIEARKRIEEQLKDLRERGIRRTSRLYLALDQRRGEISTVETLRGSKALVVRNASAPVQIQPKPRRNGILGGLLGFFLGIALVLSRNALNTRLRTPEEVHDRLGLPLLALVPDISKRHPNAAALTMLTDPRASHADAFRVLATNLDFTNIDSGARTIMVTSAKRDEGKSTVLANLAAAFARRGQRVILADLDLRRPKVGPLFGLDGGPGTTEVALDRIPIEEALVRVPLMDLAPSSSTNSHDGNGSGEASAAPAGTLDVLPAGTLPPDASEFIASPRVGKLIERLAERADIVLLDAPPILQVSDALALTTHADALLAVSRLSFARRGLLDELRRVLDTTPIVKLGLVVTGVSAGEGYGYGYSYGYGLPAAGRAGRPQQKPFSKLRDRVRARAG